MHPHDQNGLSSVLLLPVTCNSWCSISAVKAQSCKVPNAPQKHETSSAQAVKYLFDFKIVP